MAATLPITHGHDQDAVRPIADLDLVDGLRAGRRDAFEQLYERYRAPIFNLALRILQSHEDARDVTQEVFIKAYRQLPSGDGDLHVKAWLYRVAVNACYDHLRARRQHSDIDEIPDEGVGGHIDGFEQAELSRLLEQTLASLSTRHRTVLLLKDVHGLRHEEIADILGVSRGATETLLFRAREAFRRSYADLSRARPAEGCQLARQAAVSSVGAGLSEDERRKIMDHAQYCPDCRRTVRSWGAAALGLGLFLHYAAVPSSLQALPLGAGAAAAGVAASRASEADAATAGAGSVGVSGVLGGVTAKLGGLLAGKMAVVAIAATCAVTTAGTVGGLAAYRALDDGAGSVATAKSNDDGKGATGTAGDSSPGKTHGGAHSPQGNAYGGDKPHKDDAGTDAKEKPAKDAKDKPVKDKENEGKKDAPPGAAVSDEHQNDNADATRDDQGKKDDPPGQSADAQTQNTKPDKPDKPDTAKND